MCVATRIIIALFVISFVGFVTIFLVIIFAISTVIRFVWTVGWVRSVRKVSYYVEGCCLAFFVGSRVLGWSYSCFFLFVLFVVVCK